MAISFRDFIGITLKFDGKDAISGINRFEQSFERLKRVVVTVIAGKMIRDMANFGKEISLMADRTGMSIDKLASLRNVFISAGSGAKGFEQTVSKINQGLLGLNRGEGQLAGVLAPLGISPFGKDAEQLMYEIADAAKQQLNLGRSRAEVLDYLTSVIGIDPYMAQQMLDGKQAMLAERARLEERVGKQSEEGIKNLEDFQKSLNDLSAAWTNLKVNVFGQLVVVLKPVIDVLTDITGILTEFPEVGAAVVGTLGSILTILSAISTIRFAGSLFGLGGSAVGAVGGIGGKATLAGGVGFAVGAVLIGIIGESIKECIDIMRGNLTGPITRFWAWVDEELIGNLTQRIADIMSWWTHFNVKDWARNKWEGFKEWAVGWYANERANIGTAYTSTDLVSQMNKEAAKGQTKNLFGYTGEDMLIFTEPVAADSEILNNAQGGGMSIVNHFEGSTFGSDLAETESAINESMSMTLEKAIPAI